MISRYKSFYNPYKGNLLFIILLNIYNECRLCLLYTSRGGYDVSGKSELLLAEPYCLVYKELVPPESLEKVPFIKYQTDVSVANIIETWCAEHFEEPPSVAMDVNSMSTCRHFVRAGLGLSLIHI